MMIRGELQYAYALGFPCVTLTNALIVKQRYRLKDSMALVVVPAKAITFVTHPSTRA